MEEQTRIEEAMALGKMGGSGFFKIIGGNRNHQSSITRSGTLCQALHYPCKMLSLLSLYVYLSVHICNILTLLSVMVLDASRQFTSKCTIYHHNISDQLLMLNTQRKDPQVFFVQYSPEIPYIIYFQKQSDIGNFLCVSHCFPPTFVLGKNTRVATTHRIDGPS